ncbi:MAG: hypothetical protein QOK03_1557, partial [Candidatus Binataceae bacterium]|nr:hypothetical protein [Candidatus Binataceae bacterium]
SYRGRCTEAGCKNLGRLLLIYTDAGGPIGSRDAMDHATNEPRNLGGGDQRTPHAKQEIAKRED